MESAPSYCSVNDGTYGRLFPVLDEAENVSDGPARESAGDEGRQHRHAGEGAGDGSHGGEPRGLYPRFDSDRSNDPDAIARLANLWESTLTLLERGTAEDQGGRSSAAALCYSEALGGIQAILQLEQDARRRELLLARYSEYGKRLHEICADQAKASSGEADLAMEIEAPPRTADEASAADETASAHLCVELAVEADEAGDKAEALALYTTAAERLMSSIKRDPDSAAAATQRKTLYSVLDRAEQLKPLVRPGADHGLAEAEATPAALPTTPAEIRLPSPPSTRRTAEAAPPSQPPPSSSTFSSSSSSTMPPSSSSAAAAARSATAPSVSSQAKTSVSTAAQGAAPKAQLLSAEEREVLARSSMINGKLFYPWLLDDRRERFDYPTPWEDPDGLLSLSEEQIRHFGKWARPSEFMRGQPKMIYLVSALTITQTIITDCSFVSSLVIAALYERRFRKQLITRIIFPQDRKGFPIYNPSGKYMVRLKFNGIERRILVDDRLPLSRDGRLMCSHSSHKEELWVSIIEKAYLKVNGGYDFPGSNSGIDMHSLTGWIPEQFGTRDEGFNPERLWERLESASKFGDCLVTVATDEMSDAEADAVGLVSAHAYAVLQVRSVSGLRLLQLKNPWSKTRWQGAYSVHDTVRWTAALRSAVEYDLTAAMQSDNGIFWIDYPSLLRYYQGVYINWNPQLFRHHTSIHAQWPLRPARSPNDLATLGPNPQLSLSVNVSGDRAAAVWLLLTRHTTRKQQGKDDFLTVHVFKQRGGRRVYHLETCWLQGVYTNRPHCLVKFDVDPGTHTLTLALAQYKAVPHQVDYTLNVYSMAPFALRTLPMGLRHALHAKGRWHGIAAGGCQNYDSYIDNPRYLLTVAEPTDVLLELQAISTYRCRFNVLK
uniref:Calpain catalytic domain-containing protein n=1 Tax=Chrysotila carterae TaxID=13221 RepID=A0A7S4BPK7_CHRCT